MGGGQALSPSFRVFLPLGFAPSLLASEGSCYPLEGLAQAQQTLLSLILNLHSQDKLELSERPDQMVGDNPNTLPLPLSHQVTKLLIQMGTCDG